MTAVAYKTEKELCCLVAPSFQANKIKTHTTKPHYINNKK